jgi:hypothetical protein
MTLQNIRTLVKYNDRKTLDTYADLAMVEMLQWELSQLEKANYYAQL